MRRLLGLVTAFVAMVTLSGCGSGSGPVVEVVELPPVSQERAAFQGATALMTQSYVIARLRTDALAEVDPEGVTDAELEVMADQALAAWEVAGMAADGIARAAEYADEITTAISDGGGDTSGETGDDESGGDEGSDGALGGGPGGFAVPPFDGSSSLALAGFGATSPAPTLVASDKEAALQWAKELTEKYGSADTKAAAEALAKDMGKDAEFARATLEQAKEMVQGAKDEKEGNFWRSLEAAAMTIKSGCKVGLFVGGIVIAGGPGAVMAAGPLTAGGVIIGGVDTIVDVASTGSNIILGANNSVTTGIEKVQDVVGPVSAIAGTSALFTAQKVTQAMNAADKLSAQMSQLERATYVIEGVNDFVQEGKLLGGLITVGDNEDDNNTNTTNTEDDTDTDDSGTDSGDEAEAPDPDAAGTGASMEIFEIDLEDKTPEEVKEELEELGIDTSEPAEATSEELADHYQGEEPLTPERLQEYLDELEAFMYRVLTDTLTEEELEEYGLTEEARLAALVEPFVGTYECGEAEFEGEREDLGVTLEFASTPDGELAWRANNGGLYVLTPSEPNEFRLETRHESMGSEITFTFVEEGQDVTLRSSQVLHNYETGVTLSPVTMECEKIG